MALISYPPTEEQFLPVTDDTEIICTVFIGNGQSGSYTILLGDQLLGVNQPARLGKKAALIGKTTHVIAQVTDVLQETNWVSLTISMWEGASETRFRPYNIEVPNQNDEVEFIIQIHHS
ncbi:MAG: hypothetical protein JST06_10180 [Bacteroidetes bacterium]|nr:hypothetical protein [Bacteroidota bacterium]MBS1630527.1 hypothetical protein [Bacteroidota bacterium]